MTLVAPSAAGLEPGRWQNFVPRDYQRDVLRVMARGRVRRAYLLWHRRAGKDKASWVLMGDRAARGRVGNYGYFFPEYAQGKEALWINRDSDGFRTIDHLPPALVARTNEQDMLVQLTNGSTMQVLGGDHPKHLDRHRGANYVGVVLSEYARMNPYVNQVVDPMLRGNGGWKLINTTPAGPNHAKKLWDMACRNPAWFAQKLTVEVTGAVSLEEIEAEREARRGDGWSPDEIEEYIQREFYCSFAAPVRGTIYGHLITKAEAERRIGRFPALPGLQVHTCWDLGHRDANAIWFLQRERGGVVRWIHYLAGTGGGLQTWVARCQALAAERGWVFGRHIGPPDIGTGDYGADAQKRIQLAAALGFEFTQAPAMGTADAIDATRRGLLRSVFDETGCAEGLDALRSYHYEEDVARRVLSVKPLHDWASHGATAMEQWWVTDPSDARPMRKPTAPLAGARGGPGAGGGPGGWLAY